MLILWYLKLGLNWEVQVVLFRVVCWWRASFREVNIAQQRGGLFREFSMLIVASAERSGGLFREVKMLVVLVASLGRSRGGSRVFVEGGFDLRLSGLCVQLARLSQPA